MDNGMCIFGMCGVYRPYATPVKLQEMIEQSKMFSLQLPWAQRLTAVLEEANSWTDSAEQLLVSFLTYFLCEFNEV